MPLAVDFPQVQLVVIIIAVLFILYRHKITLCRDHSNECHIACFMYFF